MGWKTSQKKQKAQAGGPAPIFNLCVYYITVRGVNGTRFRIYLSSESNELREKGEVLLLTRFRVGRGRLPEMSVNLPLMAKMGQIGPGWFCHTARMSNQTIAEYLDEERQKYAATQLREAEEAARIQALQHGHHRTVKQSGLELVPPAKTTTMNTVIKKKEKKAARTRPHVAKKTAAKTRKRA
jgi:hypothetical protein